MATRYDTFIDHVQKFRVRIAFLIFAKENFVDDNQSEWVDIRFYLSRNATSRCLIISFATEGKLRSLLSEKDVEMYNWLKANFKLSGFWVPSAIHEDQRMLTKKCVMRGQ